MKKSGICASVVACFLLAACSGGEPSDTELTPIIKQAQISNALAVAKDITGTITDENRTKVNDIVNNKETLTFNAKEKQNDGSYIVSYTFSPKDTTSKGNKPIFHEYDVQQIRVIKSPNGWVVMK